MSETNLTPARKVAVLWLLLLSVFAAFNVAFIPIRATQRANAPENFVARARAIAADGDTVRAASLMQTGIERFRPAYPEPYLLLKDWGPGAFAEQAGALAAFYREHPQGPSLSWFEVACGKEGFARSRLGQLAEIYGALAMDGVIGATGSVAPVPIIAASDARAVLLIDGVDFGGDEPGMYVAMVSPDSGRILRLGHFDLAASWEESEAMTRFMRQTPRGVIGVFAVAPDASGRLDYVTLGPELEYFGLEREAMIDYQLGFYGYNYRFAAIGLKGAQPGQALQMWSPESLNGEPGHAVACAVFPPEDPA